MRGFARKLAEPLLQRLIFDDSVDIRRFRRGALLSRLWLLAAVAALGAFGLIRRRQTRQAAEPKLDQVSSDWLAYARSRSDETY